MRVGYVSNINLPKSVDFYKSFDLEEQAKKLDLDALILVGGISNDFDISYKFAEILGDRLKREGILFRFIAGNTDYYSDSVGVDKEKSFREKKEKFMLHPYYLSTNSVLRSNIVISGIESWYDYSLYRGKPVNLSKILKKRTLLHRNYDARYITDEDDYSLGRDNVFDVRYTRECLEGLDSRLRSIKHRIGDVKYNVLVQYFYPSKIFLSNKQSLFDNTGYFDAYKGSDRFLTIMRYSGSVTDCVIGMSSERNSTTLSGIRFETCTNKIKVIEYDL